MINRRRFVILNSLGLLSLGGFSPFSEATPGLPKATVVSESQLKTLLNTWFYINDASTHSYVPVELVEVIDGPKSSQAHQFSAVFRGMPEPRLDEGTHRIRHHHLGTFQLYIQSVREDATDVYYRADFNLLTSSARRHAMAFLSKRKG